MDLYFILLYSPPILDHARDDDGLDFSVEEVALFEGKYAHEYNLPDDSRYNFWLAQLHSDLPDRHRVWLQSHKHLLLVSFCSTLTSVKAYVSTQAMAKL